MKTIQTNAISFVATNNKVNVIVENQKNIQQSMRKALRC